VYRYDNKTLTQFSISNGLADNQMLSIQEDQNGDLWFGSGSFSVSRYDG
jgi:ligand-binding sensor domain-containing protein